MARVVITSKAADYLSAAHKDISNTLLRMMLSGFISQYNIVPGEEVLDVVKSVPAEEPLVVVVADSAAVATLESEMSSMRGALNTDIIRVRPEGRMAASVAFVSLPGHIVLPSAFWEVLDGVLQKYSPSQAGKAEQAPPPPPPAQPQESDVSGGNQQEAPASSDETAPRGAEGSPRTRAPAFFARILGGGAKKRVGEEEREERARGATQSSSDTEESQGHDRGEKQDGKPSKKVRVVPVRCSRVGVAGASPAELGQISANIDTIYQGAARVVRVPFSSIGAALFPVVAIVNARTIDDPLLARAAAVVVIEEETDYEQLAALPDTSVVIAGRKKLVRKVTDIVCGFVEGKE